VINTNGVNPGVYTLVLESVDLNSSIQKVALVTNTITIVVKSKDFVEDSFTLAYFVKELEQKTLVSGKSEKWTLP
jgi:hypothetical protein